MTEQKDGKGATEWRKIKADYITGKLGVNEISKKYGVSVSAIYKKSASEDWKAKKRDFCEKVDKKMINKIATENARNMAKIHRAADLLCDQLIKALKDTDQFRRWLVSGESGTEEKIFDKRDMKAINQAVQSLKSIEEIKRNLKGLLTVKEAAALELTERKVTADEKKAAEAERKGGGVDDDYETGVVLLPERMNVGDEGDE